MFKIGDRVRLKKEYRNQESIGICPKDMDYNKTYTIKNIEFGLIKLFDRYGFMPNWLELVNDEKTYTKFLDALENLE